MKREKKKSWITVEEREREEEELDFIEERERDVMYIQNRDDDLCASVGWRKNENFG